MSTFKDNWGSRRPEENYPFYKYPDKNIKFMEAQQALHAATRTLTNASNKSGNYKIHRGYIRNLEPATLLKNIVISKCNFQFNPQEIRQTVNMREDIYNPVMLTAEQLSQPIGGSVNFQFDLLFDRSHELAADKYRDTLITNSETGKTINELPHKLGVFADLKVLYEVIGQGLSNNLVELQLDNLKRTYEAKYTRDNAYQTTSDSEDDQTKNDLSGSFEGDFDIESVTTLLNSNLGNSAFLIPNPVRIVFSDLFMVDGFVTGTNVDFLKFNNYMIPMQCRVGVSVNALYIGFAKQKTFLTNTISSAKEALIEENRLDADRSIRVENQLNLIRPFVAVWDTPIGEDGANGLITDWDIAVNNPGPHGPLKYFLMPENYFLSKENRSDLISPVARVLYTGFKGIKSNYDPIKALFEDPNYSQGFTINYGVTLSIYGKLNQNDYSGNGWTLAEANAIKLNKTYTKVYGTEAVASVVGFYQVSETASSLDEWGSKFKIDHISDPQVRRRIYVHVEDGDKELPNTGAYALNFKDHKANIESSYYVVDQKFEISIVTGTITKNYSFSKTYTQTGADEYGWSMTTLNYDLE